MKIKSSAGEKNDSVMFLVIASVVCFLLSSAVVPFLFDSAFLPAPNLMLCFVCCIPAVTSIKTSAVFALVLGFLNDLFISEPTEFSPLVFLVSVCLVCYFHTHFSRIGTLVMAVCSIPAFVLSAIVMTFVVMAKFDGASAMAALTKFSVPYVAVNFAFAIIAAFAVRMFIKKNN